MFDKLRQAFAVLGHNATTLHRYDELQEMRALLNEAQTLGFPIPTNLHERLSGMEE